MQIDLGSGTPGAENFTVLSSMEDFRSRAYYAMRRQAKTCIMLGQTYRYQTRLLRYEIVQVSGDSQQVIYRMPIEDYMGFLASAALVILGIAILGILLFTIRRRAAARTNPPQTDRDFSSDSPAHSTGGGSR